MSPNYNVFFRLFVNDYGYDSCKSDVMLFVMVIELPRPPNKLGHLGSKLR